MNTIPTSAAHDIALLHTDILDILNRRFMARKTGAGATVKKFEKLCERHGMNLASADTMRAVRKRAAEYDAAKRDAYRKVFVAQ